jgi:hypothetical protein
MRIWPPVFLSGSSLKVLVVFDLGSSSRFLTAASQLSSLARSSMHSKTSTHLVSDMMRSFSSLVIIGDADPSGFFI